MAEPYNFHIEIGHIGEWRAGYQWNDYDETESLLLSDWGSVTQGVPAKSFILTARQMAYYTVLTEGVLGLAEAKTYDKNLSGWRGELLQAMIDWNPGDPIPTYTISYTYTYNPLIGSKRESAYTTIPRTFEVLPPPGNPLISNDWYTIRKAVIANLYIIAEKNLANIMGNRTYADVVTESWNYTDVVIKVTQWVDEKIRALGALNEDGTQATVNDEMGHPVPPNISVTLTEDAYAKIQTYDRNWTGDDFIGMAPLPDGYSDKKIATAKLEFKDVNNEESPLFLINKKAMTFPHDILKYEGSLGRKFVESLATFDGFDDGTDITTIAFNYADPLADDDTWWTSWSEMVSLVGATYRPMDLEGMMKFRYNKFLIEVLKDDRDGQADIVLRDLLKEIFTKNVIDRLTMDVMLEREVVRRIAHWNEIVRVVEGLDSEQLTEEGLEEALKEQEDAIAAAQTEAFEDVEVSDAEALSDEEIEGRQRFFKQCALMINIHKLKYQLRSSLQTRLNNGKMPFNGRFWMASCGAGDQERLINNLVSAASGKEFFEIPPGVVSYLTPKLRLYRVENESEGTLVETELIFDQHTDIDRAKNYSRPQPPDLEIKSSFLAADFDKGSGCGVKEFSFEFNGTNPAEARNDITANLTLFFQSFADFVRERVGYNGKTYRYVDLVLQPTPPAGDTVNGIQLVHPNQYDPTFFRIRAEVGYYVPQGAPIEYDGWEDLRDAIQRTNKSFYLNMVDHEIGINDDGSVNISISYRAFVETALKTLRFDALSTPNLIQARKENQQGLYDLLNGKEKCTKEQIQDYQVAMQSIEQQLRENALRSIMYRLMNHPDGSKVYVVTIDKQNAKKFRNRGYFTECKIKGVAGGAVAVDITPDQAAADPDRVTAELDSLMKNGLPEQGDISYTDPEDVTINYFFFGDLLATITDTLYDASTGKLVPGMENTKFILGSFDFEPLIGNDAISPINIAEIPISVDYFMQWFIDNVLSPGETRKSFPILNFIRNLSNNLLKGSLLQSCVNRKIHKTLTFQTGQISAFSENKVDPMGTIVATNKTPIIDTDMAVGMNQLPLYGDSGNEIRNAATAGGKAEHYFNYLVLNVNGSSLSFTGRGKYEEDVAKGRYHVDIGSNKGIVKTVKFSKTDMQYIREARFFQQGTNGLLQLSAVYKASVAMFGNTLFYPGMELFINPYGIGGTALGSPTRGPNHAGGRSVANILGLGGYHTITSVKTSIAPGRFETNIEAQQYYSGDGQGNPNLRGSRTTAKTTSIDETTAETQSEGDRDFCDNAVNELINFNIDSLIEGGGQSIDSIRVQDSSIIGGEDASGVTSAIVNTDPEAQGYTLHIRPAGAALPFSITYDRTERASLPDDVERYFLKDSLWAAVTKLSTNSETNLTQFSYEIFQGPNKGTYNGESADESGRDETVLEGIGEEAIEEMGSEGLASVQTSPDPEPTVESTDTDAETSPSITPETISEEAISHKIELTSTLEGENWKIVIDVWNLTGYSAGPKIVSAYSSEIPVSEPTEGFTRLEMATFIGEDLKLKTDIWGNVIVWGDWAAPEDIKQAIAVGWSDYHQRSDE
tara:strand:- start:1934 stop:6652 length:4719 start_codon:yes stop_codon:yes gene_type:complete